eukprot:TRINITY_DN3005_c0_g1_i1.p1 TRINITY_DN3005_c0_g1~~TRINITY_DN3005_c0_g1_i1.p1  ORF type:complete len:893 (+),score=207.62 TRINITY_DN3005_c0_g1_i1:62-2740(+)
MSSLEKLKDELRKTLNVTRKFNEEELKYVLEYLPNQFWLENVFLTDKTDFTQAIPMLEIAQHSRVRTISFNKTPDFSIYIEQICAVLENGFSDLFKLVLNDVRLIGKGAAALFGKAISKSATRQLNICGHGSSYSTQPAAPLPSFTDLVQHLGDMKDLQYLELQRGQVDFMVLWAALKSSKLESLRLLEMDMTHSMKGTAAFADFLGSCPTLQQVTINKCVAGDLSNALANGIAARKAANLPPLRSVMLEDAKFGTGLGKLFPLLDDVVWRVNAPGNKAGDEGCRGVAELLRKTTVLEQTVLLDGDDTITSEGLNEIADSLIDCKAPLKNVKLPLPKDNNFGEVLGAFLMIRNPQLSVEFVQSGTPSDEIKEKSKTTFTTILAELTDDEVVETPTLRSYSSAVSGILNLHSSRKTAAKTAIAARPKEPEEKEEKEEVAVKKTPAKPKPKPRSLKERAFNPEYSEGYHGYRLVFSPYNEKLGPEGAAIIVEALQNGSKLDYIDLADKNGLSMKEWDVILSAFKGSNMRKLVINPSVNLQPDDLLDLFEKHIFNDDPPKAFNEMYISQPYVSSFGSKTDYGFHASHFARLGKLMAQVPSVIKILSIHNSSHHNLEGLVQQLHQTQIEKLHADGYNGSLTVFWDSIGKCKTLTDLKISEFTDSDPNVRVAMVNALTKLPLKRFEMWRCTFGRYGMDCIAEALAKRASAAEEPPTMEEFLIYRSQAEAKHILKLCDALRKYVFLGFSVIGCDIGDKGTEALMDLALQNKQHFQHMRLDEVNATEQAFFRLSEFTQCPKLNWMRFTENDTKPSEKVGEVLGQLIVGVPPKCKLALLNGSTYPADKKKQILIGEAGVARAISLVQAAKKADPDREFPAVTFNLDEAELLLAEFKKEET